MLPPDKLRKADLVTSFVIIALGIGVVCGALRMPFGGSYGGIDSPWYASPAIFPLIIGALLILCSLSVALHALKEGGAKNFWRYWRDWLRGLPGNAHVRRIAVICVWLAALVFGMMGRINFYVAGFVFVFGFMAFFHRAPEGAPRWRGWLTALLLSLLVTLLTSYCFEKYLLVPLP